MSRKPELIRPTPDEEAAINRGIAADPDNPEWNEADFAKARPASEVAPGLVADYRRRMRGPQKAPTKAMVALRLDRDVVERLRASGPGWQTRANEALRAFLNQGSGG
jgi:uncharacterized protein (DUF4415 family)